MATPTPLFQLDLSTFQQTVHEHVEKALQGICFGESTSRFKDASTVPHIQPLEGLLKVDATSLSVCSRCNLKLARGVTSRICFACGNFAGPIPAGTAGRWETSAARERFLSLIPLSSEPEHPSSGPGRLATLRRSFASHLPSSNPLSRLGSGGSEQDNRGGESPVLNLDALMLQRAGIQGANQQSQGGGSAPATPGASRVSSGSLPILNPSDKDGMSTSSPASPVGSAPLPPPTDFFDSLPPLPVHTAAGPVMGGIDPSVNGGNPAAASEPAASPALQSVLKDVKDLSFMLSDQLQLPPERGGTFAGGGGEQGGDIGLKQAVAASVGAPATPPSGGAALVSQSGRISDGDWADFTSS